MQISLPPFPMSRLIKEACEGFSLRHPDHPLDPETGDWGLIYAAILSYLRHSQCNYDAELASGADRESLRQQVTTAAKQKYPWLRLAVDPRTDARHAKSEADAQKHLYAQRSKDISELISKKDHLIRSKSELRKAFHPDYRQRVKTINAEIAQIEAKVAQMTKSFRINKGQIHGAQNLPVEFSIPHPPEYVFAGRRLAPNYIAPTGITCPECNRRVFRTKRPVDCGCGIKLMSFSCLCINVIVRPNYNPTLAGWEELLESRQSRAAGEIFEVTQPVTFGLDD
jgi:hypothetical protein